MTEPVKLALITSLPGIFASVFAGISVVMGLLNRDAIHDVHLSLNSRLDAFLKASKDSGMIEERNRADTRADNQADKALENATAVENGGKYAQDLKAESEKDSHDNEAPHQS